MNTENRKCQNCEYYQQHQGSQGGVCRIKPPQVATSINVKGVGMPKAVWPNVRKDDWCGEFKQKTGKPTPEIFDAMKQSMNKQMH